MKWFVNKEDKTPLYLQLKDLIRYHISTGNLQDKQRLPTVHGLAKELEVNFETVRKAYKELERQGLVTMERGAGTYVKSGIASAAKSFNPLSRNNSIEAANGVLRGVKELVLSGMTATEIQDIVQRAIRQASQSMGLPLVLFVECNTLQANGIAAVLEKELGVAIRPILLKDLNAEIAALHNSNNPLGAVITTGFHIDEVRKMLRDQEIPIDYVIANMSPETRRKLAPYHAKSRFGFVYRDPESKYYKDILQVELEIPSEILCCASNEQSKLIKILDSVDVLLTTPSVYEQMKAMARPGLPVFNVQDRVDPLSLKLLKDRMAV